MLSFPTVHTLTGCLLDLEASADELGWGRPPFLLLIQDQPAPSAPSPKARQMTAVRVPVNPGRVGRYRAGLPHLLLDLATSLSTDRPLGRPTLAACVDLGPIVDRVSDPTPGLRLLAWAVCYEDVLVESDQLCEIRRVDAVDADGRGYQITRLRGEPHPVVFIDEQPGEYEPATRPGLQRLVHITSRPRPPSRTTD
ncbi:hypothetical protein [Micromonospora craniellae]|uniref:Uncharacterized protein n=1 Tax=Micromonospora craniellae TaxID=2294034 RepID=A0A372FTS1_9ACTN|nr:hypothetical protein [Micromonospora craniellae]QOC89703.1 hypothetical protein ID554_15615 [Micromonospora craniellae]RFS44177.1 hypothetical protein D0Q02_23765 [Micromonospora craniellae]